MTAQAEEDRAEKVKETLAAIEHMEVAFARCSGGNAFFGGDSIGYVDIVLGSFLFWFEAVRRVDGLEIINASKTPLLAAWAERFGGSVEAKEAVPVTNVDLAVQYINKYRPRHRRCELVGSDPNSNRITFKPYIDMFGLSLSSDFVVPICLCQPN